MAWISGIAGSVVMGIVAAFSNYFILLPLFESFMPMDQMIAAFGALIPFIHSKRDIVLYNALPSNLIKGLLITVVTMLIYKRIRPVLKGVN
jgi:riboflavin transporter FmnP